MKLPLSWLREFVPLDISAKDLADRLTFSGVEVEGIAVIGGGLGDLVVAEIQQIEAHPKADRLKVCKVFDGQKVLQIVCGATNYSVGDKVALARSGAVLPGGLRIEARPVRGVPSEGMLCAEDELGLSKAHEGLLLLDRALAPGRSLESVLPAAETVLDLEITWNRPDCLSILGMAREVAALYRAPLILPEIQFPSAGAPMAGTVDVRIEAEAECPRYTARLLRGVSVGPSPDWMRRRLELCGVRSINNIVDVTNYVLLECGQPLHAFDRARLRSDRIEVRLARAGERLKTLDGKDCELGGSELVIADGAGPVALAGIMGGEASAVVDGTREILLESACFAAPLIHATSVKLNITSESAHRFERGLDPMLADWASRRACRLFAEHCGAAPAPDVLDCFPGRCNPVEVPFRFARASRMVGVALAPETMLDVFARLQLETLRPTGEGCVVRVPSFRLDLRCEADLIEEITRIHGLADVPAAAPRAVAARDAGDAGFAVVSRCRAALVALGLTEVMHYSFGSEEFFERVRIGEAPVPVALPNPVSRDFNRLRSALLPQVLETVGRNVAHQMTSLAIFELGRIFCERESGGVAEAQHLAIAILGAAGEAGPQPGVPPTAEHMLRRIKGVIEALCESRRVPLAFRSASGSIAGYMAGATLEVSIAGQVAGHVGIVESALAGSWRILTPLAVAELDLAALVAHVAPVFSVHPLPLYPSISRDIALVVPESMQHEQIVSVIQAAAPVELTSIALFDIFRGEAVGTGRKSVAFSLQFRSAERTLTDVEANGFRTGIVVALRKELAAEIREG